MNREQKRKRKADKRRKKDAAKNRTWKAAKENKRCRYREDLPDPEGDFDRFKSRVNRLSVAERRDLNDASIVFADLIIESGENHPVIGLTCGEADVIHATYAARNTIFKMANQLKGKPSGISRLKFVHWAVDNIIGPTFAISGAEDSNRIIVADKQSEG